LTQYNVKKVHLEKGKVTRLWIEPFSYRTGFTMSREDVIRCIKSGEYRFYTRPPQGTGTLIALVEKDDGIYLRSDPNDLAEDCLIELPEY
jgi:hypothetical protein